MIKPNKLANNNFLSSLDLSREEVFHILDLSKNFKNKDINVDLKNKVLGLIFDKSSTRTRVSFQVAMSRLAVSLIGSPLPICEVVGLRSIVIPPSLDIAT
jgi:ornithine carbamoyltransferase